MQCSRLKQILSQRHQDSGMNVKNEKASDELIKRKIYLSKTEFLQSWLPEL